MDVKFSESQLTRLTAQAQKRGVTPDELALGYLEEGLRAADHPRVYFVSGPAGRRASLMGSGDVWEVVATIQDNHGDLKAAAVYLGISLELVEAAQAYYDDFPEEIDRFIEQNRLAG